MDDTFSIVSGIEDQDNLYSKQHKDKSDQTGGRRKKRTTGGKQRISYTRDGKRITYLRGPRSASRSRSRSRSRSASPSAGGTCRTKDQVTPGTCGYPTMAQVDQYSDDGQDIKKTVNGVTRYLERDDEDGQYYWVKASGKRESLNLGSRLSARTGGSSGKGVTDLMTMYMWLRKQKAQRELAATPSIDVDNMDNNEWDAYSNAFNAEFNPSSFATSKALGTCVHTTTFLGDDKYDETKSKKNTFVWKGDVKVQEDEGVFEPCQNIMFFGVVEDTKDLFKYTALPGDVNALGRDICNALYTATKSIFGVSLSGNYNAINGVLSKPQYRPTRSVAIIVLQKILDGGKNKMNVYKFAKGMVPIGTKPRFFLVPKGATLSDSSELSLDYYTIPDTVGDFDSQLHVVCGNALFMGSTSEGFLDWLFSNNYNKLTAKTLSPGNCKQLAENLAQKNPGKTVTVMYAVIDEEGVDSATTVFQTPPGPPPGPIPAANFGPPPVATPQDDDDGELIGENTDLSAADYLAQQPEVTPAPVSSSAPNQATPVQSDDDDGEDLMAQAANQQGRLKN